MELDDYFTVEKLKRTVDKKMHVLWQGYVCDLLRKKYYFFQRVGRRPGLLRAAAAAGLKLTIFYCDNGSVTEEEIEFKDLKKQTQDVGVRFEGCLLGFHRKVKNHDP